MHPHGFGTLLGVWIMFAPSILGFEGTSAEVSHRIAGPVIVTFSTTAWWQVLRGVRGMSVLAGAWLVAAPLFLMHPTPAVWNSIVTGLAVIGVSSVKGKVDKRFAGGWRSLWSDRDPS